MVFDKRTTPMDLEQMHTFTFRSDEVEHLLNGTAPVPAPNYWEYRGNNLVEKVDDRVHSRRVGSAGNRVPVLRCLSVDVWIYARDSACFEHIPPNRDGSAYYCASKW